MYEIHHTECLEHMLSMPAQSVDAILTDLPYGTTACSWDVVIPFEPMWEAVKHVLKPDGAFVTTASQPFTSLLVCSNLKWFRYEWVWEKEQGGNFANANIMPLKVHENVCVFYQNLSTYNKQYTRSKISDRPLGRSNGIRVQRKNGVYGGMKVFEIPIVLKEVINPRSVLYFNGVAKAKGTLHPAQKPVALYKYLVQTYTNPGDTVLDMCMGSGTTGEACIETGRDFIGCETAEEHFLTAQERLDRVSRQGQLFTAASSANKHLQRDQNRAEQISFLNS